MAEQLESLNQDQELGLQDLIGIIWNAKRWVIAGVVVLGALACAVAFLMTPVYRSEVVLVPASADKSGLGASLSNVLGSIGGLATLAGANLGSSGAEVEEAIAVLESRPFLTAFIRDKALLPVLFRKDWDVRSEKWDDGQGPSDAKAHQYFLKKVLSVQQDARSSLIVVRVDWSDPVQSANWANEIVARLNAEMRKRALQKSEASLKYLEKELASTSVLGAQDAISRLIETQINQRMLANVVEEYSFRIVEPALPADSDDPIRPKKFLIILAGLIFGGVLGIVAVLLSTLFRPQARS